MDNAMMRTSQQPQNAMLNATPPQTWSDMALSFGKHVASLPVEMVKGAWDAVTLPGRAYRGEVPQNQMMPEAFNFAGNVALGGYMAPKPAGALGMSGGGKGITAYHGSPHDFDKFDMGKIGTGEGAQAYGHGLYFAENEGVARNYRDALARGPADDPVKPPGRMYEVRINAEPDDFLDWDKPLIQQSEAARTALAPILDVASKSPVFGREIMEGTPDIATIRAAYRQATGAANNPPPPSTLDFEKRLREAGIPGIRYLDQGSRGVGEGSRNYVVFDDKMVEIMRKYGLLGMFGAGAMSGAGGDAEASP